MNEKILKLIDPEILEGMKQLPAELAQGGPIEQSYPSIRELLKRMESAPFESTTMTMEERQVNSQGRDIRVLIYKPKDMNQHSGICVYWIHGGGNVLGTPREDDIAAIFVDNLKCTMVSADYKVAPEHQHPEGMEDCYAGLVWTAQHAEELGFDKNKIAVCGESAGGGMAARTVLLNRERKEVDIAFQLLKCPMLDNTHDTPSGRLSGYLGWDRDSSLWAWNAYLGGDLGKEATPLQSPSRATDLSGLPPTFLYVGAVELFRDEVIAYAQQLMKDGVPTELYVAPGVLHGGERMAPNAKIAQTAHHLMVDAVKRAFKL
ncbi:MAG TPA: alpha/beta hydrolase [Saprospiraceae bacterium]|nr:alpha/beta hydrolase [Saprospiraceae bacterium]